MTDNLADALRRLADTLDAHPDLPLQPRIEATWHLSGDDQKAQALAIRRAIPAGRWEKAEFSDSFWLEGSLDGIGLTVFIDRPQVCERVVTTEEVTVPAQPARPAEPERVEVVEKVEWRCDPILAEAATS